MFHVAILTVREIGFRGWAVLELLETDGELLETDGDEKDCFAMCGGFWCFVLKSLVVQLVSEEGPARRY